MNHRQTVQAVARRLPRRTQRDIEEMLQVLIEVWSEALATGEQEITLRGLGKLTLEVQMFPGAGALRGIEKVQRVYGRFNPTQELRAKLKEKPNGSKN